MIRVGDDDLASVAWEAEQAAERLTRMADGLDRLHFPKTAAVVRRWAEGAKGLSDTLTGPDDPA